MKSNILNLTVLCSLLVTLLSCEKKNIIGIVGKGGNDTEVRAVSGFDQVTLKTDADVLYTQDSTFFVEVTGQKNILAVLETRNENGNLVIDFRKNVWKHNKVTITVHSPSMHVFSISGSGDIEAQKSITTSDLKLQISGSGNMTLPSLNATHLEAKISGSGNINIQGGTTVSQNLSISGSGNMSLEGLSSSTCTCRVSGSGNITLQVSEDLDASISGSGDVKYKGYPRINSNISGSGRLTRF